MHRFLSSLLVCCAIGCSNTQYHVDGGSTPDAGGPMGVLTLESESALTLTFGQSMTIAARYTEADVAIRGQSIRFALEGRAHDATLADVTATTDEEGRVETVLTAGSTPSAFRVRASADRAAPVYVNVSVGNMGFGGLRVGAAYTGAREGASRRVIDVYSEMGCDDELPPSPDRTLALDDATQLVAEFPVLPAGLRYAVRGRVLGPSGAVLASACIDEVEVIRDREVRVDLVFEDQGLVVDGDYDVTLGIAPATSAELVAELARAAGGARVDAAGSGAALYLDAIEEELRARGADVAADALATERIGGAPEAALGSQLDDAGEGPHVALDPFADRLGQRLSLLTLSGPLALDLSTGVEGAFGALALALGPMGDPDSLPPLPIDPSAAGIDLAPEATWSFAPGDAALGLESLVLSVPLGTLATAVIEAETSMHGYDDPAGLLHDSGAGCEVLASWTAESATLAPLCNEECANAACIRALDHVVESMRAALAVTDETHGQMMIHGSIELVDEDGDLIVDRVVADSLEGAWSSPAGTGDPLSGQLSGTRASSEP